MRIQSCLLACLILLSAFSCAWGVECTISPDRMAVVDGQRTFILGLYENPKSDEALHQVAEAGFNLVRASESTEALDRLQQEKLWAWINTGASIDLSTDKEARLNALKEMVSSFGSHPALLVWEVPDEALWNAWYGALRWRKSLEPEEQHKLLDALPDGSEKQEIQAQMNQVQDLWDQAHYAEAEDLANSIWTRLGKDAPKPEYRLSNAPERAAVLCEGMCAGYARLRALDPAHPVWMNHAPRNQIAQLAAFNHGADIVGCDIYPVPRSKHQGHSDIDITTVAAVGDYTQRMQDAAPGKPVWMVLQGFGWADLNSDPTEVQREELKRPTPNETRFMAFDSIVRGARGILYWGTAYVEKDSEFWTELLAAVRELADLQPLLSAPDADIPLSFSHKETYGSVDRALCALPKNVNGKTWLIFVNEWSSPLECQVQGAIHGIFRDTITREEFLCENGVLPINMRGHGVRVLEPIDK